MFIPGNKDYILFVNRTVLRGRQDCLSLTDRTTTLIMRSLTGLSPCQFLGHSAGTGCTSQWESWCTLDALQLCSLDVWIFVQSLLVLTFIVPLKPQYTRDRIAAHYLIINVEPPQARIYQMLFFFYLTNEAGCAVNFILWGSNMKQESLQEIRRVGTAIVSALLNFINLDRGQDL